METTPGEDAAAPEQAKDTARTAPGPGLSGLDSDLALYDLRRGVASRSSSYRLRRRNVDEAFGLLLHPAVQKLPYCWKRSLPSNWEAGVRAEVGHRLLWLTAGPCIPPY